MADRVVDDSNPEARLSSKEIQKLICDDENDPPPNSWNLDEALEQLEYADPGAFTSFWNEKLDFTKSNLSQDKWSSEFF